MASGKKETSSSTTSTASPQTETFTFFYSTSSPFSQFHPCSFKGVPLFPDDATEQTFSSAEQWMMLNKANLFKDYEIAQQIQTTHNDPAAVKRMGREVKNFDLEIWKKHNRRIIYEGNKHKFSQNPDLLEALKNTEGTTLVEASANDRIYGIGLRETDPRALSRKTWQGMNILGETLTKLRKDLITPVGP